MMLIAKNNEEFLINDGTIPVFHYFIFYVPNCSYKKSIHQYT
jgi:hypothetical protein